MTLDEMKHILNALLSIYTMKSLRQKPLMGNKVLNVLP